MGGHQKTGLGTRRLRTNRKSPPRTTLLRVGIVQLDQNVKRYQQGADRIHLPTQGAVENAGRFPHEIVVGKAGPVGGWGGGLTLGMKYFLAQQVGREGELLIKPASNLRRSELVKQIPSSR
jgi:hypothetical protein